MNAMRFNSPPLIIISDDEDTSGWVQLDEFAESQPPPTNPPIALPLPTHAEATAIDSTNDLDLPVTVPTTSYNLIAGQIVVSSADELPRAPPPPLTARPMTVEWDEDSEDQWLLV